MVHVYIYIYMCVCVCMSPKARRHFSHWSAKISNMEREEKESEIFWRIKSLHACVCVCVIVTYGTLKSRLVQFVLQL